MRDWIYTDKLFCNDYKAVVLCEYTKELFLLREFIEVSERAVCCKGEVSRESCEGVCHMFAKSIIDYAKMAYDNIILGHYFATNMILRAMVENRVLLEIIFNDEKEELWKYYFVQSYRSLMKQAKGGLPQEEVEFIQKLYVEYDISEEFYSKRGKNKPYIDLPYGWTYKINVSKQFNFKGICDLVSKQDYNDFSMMSDYSHGTSVYQKMGGSICIEHIMNMLSCIYVCLYRLVTMYCWDCAEETFDELAERIEDTVCCALGI